MERDAHVERFASLYHAARPRLLAYALRRTASPEDAADVIAETFTIGWRRFDDVPDGEASVLWLYATARRVIANHGRRVQHRSRLVELIGSNLATGIASQLDPADDVAIESTLALARLSDNERELLMLAGWEGLDSTQLGCVLGCSASAARVRLHQARVHLKAELVGLGVGTSGGGNRRGPARSKAEPRDAPEEAEAR